MNPQEHRLAAYVGIDWADQQHQVCLQIDEHSPRRIQPLNQTPEAITEWALKLKEQFPAGLVGVCLEQSRGPLIYALSQFPWLVLYPINPKSLARYREALHPSQSKDDPTDAELLCRFLQLHQPQLRAWHAEEAATRRLRLLLENRKTLVDDRTRLANRLTDCLKHYYPQALRWAGPLTQPLAWDFLLKWPTLAQVQRAQKKTVLAFYYAHHVRRGDQLTQRYQEMQQAIALIQDLAIVEPTVSMVQALCRQLHAVQRAICEHDREIAAVFATHADHDLFAALPGAGPVMAPRLVVAFGTDRGRWQEASELQKLSGIAPVMRRSGNTCWVHWRWAAPAFLRQTFHEYALHSLGGSPWAAAYYHLAREKGKSHHAAVRALAFKWIRILYRCWKEHTPYDETRYLTELKRRGAPLIHHLQPEPQAQAA